MPLREVDKVRHAIIYHQAKTLAQIRSYLSLIDGNVPACDSLKGEGGDGLLARITGLILDHVGHTPQRFLRNGQKTVVPADHRESHIWREISRMRGRPVVDEAEEVRAVK